MHTTEPPGHRCHLIRFEIHKELIASISAYLLDEACLLF